MEEIALLVSASLARNGFVTTVDHRRLQWSHWSRCESSGAWFAPAKPGLFQLAEASDFQGGSERNETPSLTIFRVSESEDLGLALGLLFLGDAPQSAADAAGRERRDRLSTKPTFVRYAIIEDAGQRHATLNGLQESRGTSPALSTELPLNLTVHSFAKDKLEDACELNEGAPVALPLARTGT